MSKESHRHARAAVDARLGWHTLSRTGKRAATSWFTRQAVLIVGAYFVYFLVRGFTEGSAPEANEHANWVVDFERSMGFFWEIPWQDAIIEHLFLVRLANSVYMYGHWPVITGVAIWLASHHRSRYILMRNAILISGAIGLVCFVTFPTAPPRLTDSMDIVDTVTVHSNAYRLLQPPALTNQYAAVPSLHLGWNMLVGMALYLDSSSRTFRVFGILLPVAMLLAVVVTGNHFIFDAITGIAVALIGLGIAVIIQRRGAAQTPASGAVVS